MRQIKFRVWDKKEKRWLPENVVVKDIGQKDERKYPNPIRAYNEINILIDRDGNICAFEYDMDNGWSEFDLDYDRFEYVLKTGLKDKNDKEIFEGDIGKHKYYPADVEMGTTIEIEEVSFAKGAFGLKRGEDNLPFREVMDTEEDFEVIGNKFENGDLLK